MSSPAVTIITITDPIVVLGRHFTGDYYHSQKYIMEIQDILKKEDIGFAPFKVFGIYYDNPGEKSEDELRSFHGVFPDTVSSLKKTSLETLKLTGKFIQTKVKGDPSTTIMEGYGALFSYIQQNGVKLKSQAGYQTSTYENGEMATEILMEIE